MTLSTLKLYLIVLFNINVHKPILQLDPLRCLQHTNNNLHKVEEVSEGSEDTCIESTNLLFGSGKPPWSLASFLSSTRKKIHASTHSSQGII